MLFGGACNDDTDSYISYSATEMELKGTLEWKELQQNTWKYVCVLPLPLLATSRQLQRCQNPTKTLELLIEPWNCLFTM